MKLLYQDKMLAQNSETPEDGTKVNIMQFNFMCLVKYELKVKTISKKQKRNRLSFVNVEDV